MRGRVGEGEAGAGSAGRPARDTIVLTDDAGTRHRVRLAAVDAPEMRVVPWGAWARAALDALIGGGRVVCTAADPARGRADSTDGGSAPPARGRSRRIVATCRSVGIADPRRADLGAALIAGGYAVEHRAYGGGVYRAEEDAASLAGRGLWAGWLAEGAIPRR